MSNYPNMSYCMFENTYSAMVQVVDAMREAEEKGELEEFYADLSKQERNAMRFLAIACEEYHEAVQALEEALETE